MKEVRLVSEQPHEEVKWFTKIIREFGDKAGLSDYKRGKLDACTEMIEHLFQPEEGE